MAIVLVTVGTCEFDALVQVVLQSTVLEVVKKKFPSSHLKLIIQKGLTSKFKPTSEHWLNAKKLGIELEFLPIVSDFPALVQSADFVVSHAGAGSVLELLAQGKASLVVVNQSLMQNHQLEFAQRLFSLSLIEIAYLESFEEDFFNACTHPKKKIAFATISDFPIY
jgi:beta-1,4-N-acetylglucosaminyltransferase